MKALARKRAGRPRKEGPRHKSGQLVQAFQQGKAVREAKSVALDQRRRIHGLGGCDLAGYTLGRMYLDKTITKAMLEAGNAYGDDVFRYFMTYMGKAPTVSAQNLARRGGFDGDVTKDQADAGRKALNRHMQLDGLLSAINPRVKSTVYNICVEDSDAMRFIQGPQLDMFRRGLEALIAFYGLQEG